MFFLLQVPFLERRYFVGDGGVLQVAVGLRVVVCV